MLRKKLTITQKILLTLSRNKGGASWRRLAGWHNKVSASSIYQTLYRLKKAGLVSKLDRDRFTITDTGIKKLEKDGLLKIAPEHLTVQ